MKTIAYQGVKGAYSYITALHEFGEEHCFRSAQTFREVFDLLHRKEADTAVLPVENSLIGSIYENYDLLNQYRMQIVGEHYTKIEHCLLAVPSNGSKHHRLQKIKRVLSHPKALEQCTHFFHRHPWVEAVAHMDTAGAAKDIAENNNPAEAAIASACAGKMYGLDLLDQRIADDPCNYTRFVIVEREKQADSPADKCTLQLQLKHAPGALNEALQPFARHQLNLTKIESRPMRGSLFEYVFYLDFEFKAGHRHEFEEILAELRKSVNKLIVLGLYKKGNIWKS